MPHGDRWAAITGDTRSSVDGYLPRITKEGKPTFGAERRFVWPIKKWFRNVSAVAKPIGMFLAEGPVGFFAILLENPRDGGFEIQATYPFPLGGVRHSLLVRDIEEDSMGLEAFVGAETESGVLINFFAVDYFLYPHSYVKNSVVEVSLSGLAYTIRLGDSEDVVISDLARVQKFREAGLDVPADQPLRFGTKNAAMLLPLGWEPCEYSFQSPFTGMEKDGNFYRMVISVARADDKETKIELLAGLHLFSDGSPNTGPAVSGRCSITGCLVPGEDAS